MDLAFVTANYVGRAMGYQGFTLAQWGAAERATVEHTDLAAFDAICADVARAGFRHIELWKAHAWPATLSPERADDLLATLQRHHLSPISYAAGLGDDPEGVLRAARLLGVPIVAGGLFGADAREVARIARRQTVRVALENHPERDPQELADQIGGDDDVLGACVDTGWWLTQGYNPAEAIRRLGRHVFHIHLKDIRAAGAHETVQLGTGLMDVGDVLAAIREIGYSGPLGIEHEPEHYDPTAEVVAGRELVERLLAARA